MTKARRAKRIAGCTRAQHPCPDTGRLCTIVILDLDTRCLGGLDGTINMDRCVRMSSGECSSPFSTGRGDRSRLRERITFFGRTCALAMVVLPAFGCAEKQLLVVRDSSWSEKELRLLLVDLRQEKQEPRVVRCHRGPDGSLTGCTALPIKFEGED
jgi:hypothetical protein